MSLFAPCCVSSCTGGGARDGGAEGHRRHRGGCRAQPLSPQSHRPRPQPR